MLACGCSFPHGTIAGDGAPGDDMMGGGDGDVRVDGTPLGPWAPPTAFPELTAAGTQLDDPTLTADMLEIYFDSTRGAGGDDDIWRATRPNVQSVWSTPVTVGELNTNGRESDPEISSDGLTLWIASDRNGGAGLDDIYVSTRTSRGMPWSTPVRVASLCSAGADDAPTTDATSQRVVFWSTRSGGAGGGDLYEATRNGTGWNTPQRIAELCTAANDYDPFLTGDALAIYFDSDRVSATLQDLYVASRPSVSMPFGAPQAITELDSPARDMDPWLTPDLRTMVFASNRSGEYEIYWTTR